MSQQILQNGSHIARFDVVKTHDDLYEAQVFVRLTREPALAETYIPAGWFGSHQEALEHARQRAERALKEHEF